VRDASFQAAEAGIEDYISKLVEDRLYYVHQVHPAEATRRDSGTGTLVSGSEPMGTAWTYGLSWTYPNGSDRWRALSNGYEYSLQITPPGPGSQATKIVATGRKVGSTEGERRIEALVRPSSVTDFQMLANADIFYGAAATTYGKIYAGIDTSNVKHNVRHDGFAYADIYAEGDVTGLVTMMNGAKKYDDDTNPNIRTPIKNPVNFASFLASLVDIQRAAQAGGVFLDDPSVDGWRLTFQSGGTFTAKTCTRTAGNDIAAVAPTCSSTATTYIVPSNGAVYVAQSAIVSGQVKGRVTVASNDRVVIADNINPVTPGTDVVGLISKNDMIVAQWVPLNLTWRAATLAQSGSWRSWTGFPTTHGTMTFTGSTVTYAGGYMSMFAVRVYNYDSTLLYLQPPWFPTIEDAYTVLLFRELSAP
jgi:hypothetical protein